jgi:alkanesulfonate monooxygenase SsuD/methylene tetrahydromethanopterin reductase-like flavin-dependent oxidoreductase (luciferase family)
MEEEYHAYGYPFPPVRVRIEQLGEALEIITRMLSAPPATFAGEHFTTRDAVNNPKPVQQPRPPILIGGAGEKRLLPLVARYADIWNCPNNHSTELPRRLAVLREHCARLGRDPAAIEVSEQTIIVLGRTEAELAGKWERAQRVLGKVFDLERTAFRGTPEQVAEQLRRRVKQGVTFFTFLLGDGHNPESLELLAEKVIPNLSP